MGIIQPLFKRLFTIAYVIKMMLFAPISSRYMCDSHAPFTSCRDCENYRILVIRKSLNIVRSGDSF